MNCLRTWSQVTGHRLKLDSTERTHTLIACHAHSKFDLERMFGIGMEEG